MSNGSRPVTRAEVEEWIRELQEKLSAQDRRDWQEHDEHVRFLDSRAGAEKINRYAREHNVSLEEAFQRLLPTPPRKSRPITLEQPNEIHLDEQITQFAADNHLAYEEAAVIVLGEQTKESTPPAATYSEDFDDAALNRRVVALAQREGITYGEALTQLLSENQ